MTKKNGQSSQFISKASSCGKSSVAKKALIPRLEALNAVRSIRNDKKTTQVSFKDNIFQQFFGILSLTTRVMSNH